eukprot:CAMPEP_0118943166 /NCGR_PEP_ID=MMETSP1169-20130426/37673_1 /TAXON_ID=36882 /ORGANISM="Pyramimonas obovata, Strain CCMP722" /LENGTH=143 /DNA_ID=CAMNT_0006888343 /DNA_START=114 /DNA_END=542 /DNA_ORIENTATION=+
MSDGVIATQQRVTVVRVKRKRAEQGLDTIILESDERSTKRQTRTAAENLAAALDASMSLHTQAQVKTATAQVQARVRRTFRRVDTIDAVALTDPGIAEQIVQRLQSHEPQSSTREAQQEGADKDTTASTTVSAHYEQVRRKRG